MHVPHVFERMVIMLTGDAMPDPMSEVIWFANVRRSFDEESLKEISRFLDVVLNDATTDAMLQDLWQSCYPSYIMSDSHLRIFLKFVRSQL